MNNYRGIFLRIGLLLGALLIAAVSAPAQDGTGELQAKPAPTPRRTTPPHPTLPQRPVAPRPAPAARSPKIEMVLIKGGTFIMGSPESEVGRSADEGPQHQVTLSSFHLGKYEVTQAQWRAVMGNDPSYFAGCDRCPVEQVSWNDVQGFIQKLNSLGGKYVYRLPTEAEWEYAARAGTTTPFSFGSSLRSTQANFNGNSPYGGASKGPYLLKTAPVGKYLSNARGVYDMHGNVWEWCQDWFEKDYYARSEVNDPKGASTGNWRVLRGGSWLVDAGSLRSAYRGVSSAAFRDRTFGFRLAAAARTR